MKGGWWKKRADSLKKNTYALYLAARDPRVPFPAKTIIALVVAYALSPIDLIPDFIPIIGYLDDLLLLPLGIWLALKLVPKGVWDECLTQASKRVNEMPSSSLAAVVIIVIWLLALLLLIFWLWEITIGKGQT